MLYHEVADALRNQGFTVDIYGEGVGVEDDMCQGTTHYAQLWTTATYTEVLNAVQQIEKPAGCGHQYDCCGCWFFQGFRVANMYQKEGIAYIAVESYSRNF